MNTPVLLSGSVNPTAALPAAGLGAAEAPLVICYDRDLRVVRANRGALLFAGRGAADAAFCPIAGPTRRCGDTCPVQRAHATGLLHEAFFSFADGRTRQVRAEPLFDAAGAPAGVLEVIEERDACNPREEMLRGHLRDVQTVLDSINDAIFVHDAADGAVLHVSAAACRMYGYAPEDLLHRDIGSLSAGEPPYTQAEALRWLAKARADGPQVFEWSARQRNGELFWVEASLRFGRLDGGERFFVTVRDIGRRKAAEEKLRLAEKNFRNLLASINEGVCVQDRDGHLLEVNPACEGFFGLSRAELLGRTPQEFAASDRNDPEQLLQATRRAFDGEPQRFEFWARRANGTLFSKEVSLTPGVFSGQPVVIAVLRDITERKQEEEERERAAAVLRQSEERFRLLLGRVPTVAVQGYGPDGTVRYWNAASEALYGYTAAEAIGRNLVDLIIPPPMRSEVRKAVHQMTTSGEPIPAAELQLLRKDGTLVPVFSSHAVVTVPGIGTELYCLDVDLTERKQEEEQRLELERRLLNAQKLESLGVLAGGIAHDFNNLLTGVLGNLELAASELAPAAAMRPLLEDAILSARRAADLTHQMLAYAGRQRFHPETVDVNRVVRDQLPLLHAALPHGTSLHLELAATLPPFEADPIQLRQLLVNLVTNAAEAIGRTSGAVELRTGVEECDAARLARSHLEERPAPGRFVFVEIVDTGCGMDAATQQRLFDPFFSTKFAGRGLGMPVVLGIVRAHHGALFVDSTPGRGTTVRALFSAPTATAAPVPANAPGSGASATSPTELLVLLVDDEEPVRKIAQRMGQRLGFEVLAASDGEAGLALLRAHAARVSCAILDLTMPTMDGVECLRAMRTIQPDLPAVLASGFAVTTIEVHHSDAGFSAFLQKPFTMEQFAGAVRQAIAAANR